MNTDKSKGNKTISPFIFSSKAPPGSAPCMAMFEERDVPDFRFHLFRRTIINGKQPDFRYGIALNRSGRYEEALMLCDRLEKECMDNISATAFRTTAYLNLGHFQQAADSALKIKDFDPSEGLIAGFEVYELGRTEDALALFIHGALNYPRAARLILGIRTDPYQSSHEARDHNAGIDISRDLNAYLQKKGRKTRRFFKGMVKGGRVGALLSEMDLVIRRWSEQHPTDEREAFDRMKQMQQPEFARKAAQELVRKNDLKEKHQDLAL